MTDKCVLDEWNHHLEQMLKNSAGPGEEWRAFSIWSFLAEDAEGEEVMALISSRHGWEYEGHGMFRKVPKP